MTRLFIILCFIFVSLFSNTTFAQAPSAPVTVFLFGRDKCTHCADEKIFLDTYVASDSSVSYVYLNVIDDEEAKATFEALLKKHELSHVTPLTVIGGEVIQGFSTEDTTGVRIKEMVLRARSSDIKTIEDHLARAPKQSDSFVGTGCDENGTSCDSITNPNQFVFNLPLLGVVDLKTLSLFSLSAILGTIDGFNPCAMWVLITFLVLLSQIGDRKKMVMVASIFVVAEAIMYNLILNVWFTAWDFVGLDAIVTPLVGLLAVGGGIFFLYRYRKNRNKALTCDISDIESQGKTTARIKDLISRPTTILTIFGIIALAGMITYPIISRTRSMI